MLIIYIYIIFSHWCNSMCTNLHGPFWSWAVLVMGRFDLGHFGKWAVLAAGHFDCKPLDLAISVMRCFNCKPIRHGANNTKCKYFFYKRRKLHTMIDAMIIGQLSKNCTIIFDDWWQLCCKPCVKVHNHYHIV